MFSCICHIDLKTGYEIVAKADLIGADFEGRDESIEMQLHEEKHNFFCFLDFCYTGGVMLFSVCIHEKLVVTAADNGIEACAVMGIDSPSR